MDRRDIALTVGGVLSTMVLAYLIYRLERRDQAQAQATQAAAGEAIDLQYSAANYNPGLNAYAFDEAQAQGYTPLITGVASNTTASVATSSNTSDQGAYIDTTDVNHILTDVIGAFSGSSGVTASFTPTQLEALSVPSVAGVAQTALSGIPTTAQDAAAQAMLALSPSVPTYYSPGGSGPGYYSPGGGGGPIFASYPMNMESSPAVSSHPVQPHPIVTTGS